MRQSFRCYRMHVLLLILLSMSPILAMVVYSQVVDPYEKARIKVQESINDNFDGFLLGSSHANSLDIGNINRQLGISISKHNHSGSDLFEIIYQIKTIKKKSPKPKIFFIALSPFLFHYDNDSYVYHGKKVRGEKRVRLYAIYRNFMDLINSDWHNLLYAFFFPAMSFDFFEKIHNINAFSSLAYVEKSKPILHITESANSNKVLADIETNNIQNMKNVETSECNLISKANELDEHAIKRIKDVFTNNLIPNMEKNATYDIPSRSLEMFENLIKAYPEDFFVVYIPPFWGKYYLDIPNDIMSFFKYSVNDLSSFSNVYLYDYSKYAFVADNPCYFLNSDHLNEEGGRIFTNYFVDDLKKTHFVENLAK